MLSNLRGRKSAQEEQMKRLKAQLSERRAKIEAVLGPIPRLDSISSSSSRLSFIF